MWCVGFLSEGIRFCIFKPTLFHCSNIGVAVVVENSGGYAKMAHNVRGGCCWSPIISGDLLQLSCYYDVAGGSKVLMKCDSVTAQPPLTLLRIAACVHGF